jgi:hypothetical protein
MVVALTSQLPRILKLLCACALPLALVAEVMTISRAGVTIISLVLFAATIATIRYRITPRMIGMTLVVVIGVTGLAAKSWKTLSQRFGESTMQQEYGNKKNMGRGYYIRMAKAIAAERFFGVGLNNWSYWVSNRYGPQHGYKFVPYKGTERWPSDIVPSDSNVDEAQAAPLELSQYEPKSMLHVHESHVERSRFPLIDFHTHLSGSTKSQNGVELSPDREYLGTPQELLAVMDRVDVDTDQIIPKQFLKRIERSGYGEFLFYDWMKDPDATG